MNKEIDIEKKYKPLIIVLSILLPLVIGLLGSVKVENVDLSFLPGIYASINACVAILLVTAVIAIKNKKRMLHERLIKLAMLGSLLFLAGYVAYHITSEPALFGDINLDGELSDDESKLLGSSASVYYFILFTHIILSVVIIPMVLFTYLKGIAGNVVAHRKLAKYTFPLWLYVAVTGVVVYLMISPFYS